MGPQDDNVALVMDRAYQGDETRQLALDLGFTPVVPPLKTRTDPWGAHSRFPGHALTPTGVMAIRCKQFHLPDL